MALYRECRIGTVRLDSRTITIIANAGTCVGTIARQARIENGGEPVRFDASWTNGDGSISRRYFRYTENA
jgi:hypothetical protein